MNAHEDEHEAPVDESTGDECTCYTGADHTCDEHTCTDECQDYHTLVDGCALVRGTHEADEDEADENEDVSTGAVPLRLAICKATHLVTWDDIPTEYVCSLVSGHDDEHKDYSRVQTENVVWTWAPVDEDEDGNG